MNYRQETIARIGSSPHDDALSKLRHVVRVFEDVDSDEKVVTATQNVYGDGVWTGLTHGDLRELLARISP